MPLFTQSRRRFILRSWTSVLRRSKKLAVLYGSGQSAVYADVLPSDVARVLGEEERRRLRDLRDRTPPAHRYRLLGSFVYLEALYVAQQDVVHPDALCCVAVGVELREAGQSGAQGGGDGEGGGGLEGREGGDVDDGGGAALPEHRRRHQAGDAHDVQHHQVEGIVPLLVREIQDLPRRGMAGAVGHPVYAAVPVEGFADEGLKVVLFRDRTRETEAPELLRQSLGLARGGHQRHRVAPACEFSGAGGPMPLPAVVTIAAFSLSLPDLLSLIGRPLPSRPFLQLLEHRSNVIMTLFTQVLRRVILGTSRISSPMPQALLRKSRTGHCGVVHDSPAKGARLLPYASCDLLNGAGSRDNTGWSVAPMSSAPSTFPTRSSPSLSHYWLWRSGCRTGRRSRQLCAKRW